jgi:hypothetical protein
MHIFRLAYTPHIFRLAYTPHIFRLAYTPHIFRLVYTPHIFRLAYTPPESLIHTYIHAHEHTYPSRFFEPFKQLVQHHPRKLLPLGHTFKVVGIKEL